MMLCFVLALLLATVLAGANWPQEIITVPVTCPTNAGTLFECTADWSVINGSDDENSVCTRINNFFDLVSIREEVGAFNNEYKDTDYSIFQGNELYNNANKFFSGCIDMKQFITLSYYLDYFSNNVFTVSSVEDKKVVGFSGGIFSAENSFYDEAFMDAFRDITVQYQITIEGVSGSYYAIGYLGTFSLPYFFSTLNNEYVKEFSVAYNADYDWSVKHGGNFTGYTKLFNEGNGRTIPPGIFMVNFVAPYHPEVNTVDPYGYKTEKGDDLPDSLAPIDSTLFKFMFALRYGLRNEGGMGFMDSVLAYSADGVDTTKRYTTIGEGSWNYCRSLGRNNLADVEPADGQYHEYDYVEESASGNYEEYICNSQNLPSVFFMTYSPNDTKPLIYSTKYQLMSDGSCQARADLDKSGFPATSETYVVFGESYKATEQDGNNNDDHNDIHIEEDEPIEGLPGKTAFVLDGNDFFALHVVDKRSDSYMGEGNEDVPTKYKNYVLNADNVNNLYYDGRSMCNTGISDIYVLYDMKSYANVYGSLSAITKDSYGVASVYNSMRSFPTKSNYTAVVSSAQFYEDEMKVELQKCVNVFLDTQGNVIAACNDVTSTWNWAVFGGSFAGICVVVGLWVWGGLYNKKFNKNTPGYYTDLVEYEPEWRRLQAEQEKNKKNKKGIKTTTEENENSSSSSHSASN